MPVPHRCHLATPTSRYANATSLPPSHPAHFRKDNIWYIFPSTHETYIRSYEIINSIFNIF
ncbi:hypothetical protein HanRHA438_Chr00c06g0845651 [Helianthus annuus]|nr:hypothetical protein HanRHA438_Chr00c06g0845651 [Helianthus annuus]